MLLRSFSAADLPDEDQKAISEIVGKPILLREYDEAGKAALEFSELRGIQDSNLANSRQGIERESADPRHRSTSTASNP